MSKKGSNRVVDFLKRTDHEFRDSKVPEAPEPELDFSELGTLDRFGFWLDEAVVDTWWFEACSGSLIGIGAVLTGIQVERQAYYDARPEALVNQLDVVIVYLFCIECLVRVATEGSSPWRYFTGEKWFPRLTFLQLNPPGKDPPGFFERALISYSKSEWEVRAKWNCFDFCISFLSLVLTFTNFGLDADFGGAVASVRLCRVIRLLSLMQRFEELRLILDGFSEGLESFAYVGALLLMVFYVYGILGLYTFGANDPAHFGNLGAAMVSLFRAATLSAWYELMYINWYGCDVYSGGAYALGPNTPDPYANETGNKNDPGYVPSPRFDDDAVYGIEVGADDDAAEEVTRRESVMWWPTETGEFPAFVCNNPSAQPALSFAFFFSFTLLSSFVVLSLLVGVVTIAMQNAMGGMHTANLRDGRDVVLKSKHKEQARVYTRYKLGGRDGNSILYDIDGVPRTQLLMPVIPVQRSAGQRVRGKAAARAARLAQQEDASEANAKAALSSSNSISLIEETQFQVGEVTPIRATLKHLMKLVICGKIEVKQSHMPTDMPSGSYLSAVRRRGVLSELYLAAADACTQFVASSTYSALLVSLIGLYAGTVGAETYVPKNAVVVFLQTFCVLMFVLECVVKVIAEGFKPWRYFFQVWNVFDFTIAFGSVLSIVSGGAPAGFSLARLLRLVQVFKLAYRLPKLQLVTESLLYGCRSMVWVALLFALFNYLFAVAGIILFRDNDSFHFGGLSKSLRTIWVVETLNNWEQPMFVNVYGCAKYGYGQLSIGRLMGDTVYNLPEECTNSHAMGAISIVYFCTVACIGGLVLPTLLTAVITASTVHLGKNREDRAKGESQVENVVALAPGYLHPERIDLLRVLFENLDVSGDGHLEPTELAPAFTALSDDILRHTNPEFIRKLFALVDQSDDGLVDFSEFLSFFSRLSSAMALRLDWPPHSFVEDPQVFEVQFLRLLLDMGRTAVNKNTKSSSTSSNPTSVGAGFENSDALDAPSSYKKEKFMLRSGALGVSMVVGLGDAGVGSTFQGVRHEPATIFNVFETAQLHQHIAWMASDLARVQAETTASKKALKQLKHQLGAFHPDSARAAAVEQQEAAAAADASLVPKRKRTSRTQLQKSGSADIMSSSSASSSSSADPVSLNHYGTPSSTDNASNDPMAALGAIVKRQADLGKLAHSDWPSESGWRAKAKAAEQARLWAQRGLKSDEEAKASSKKEAKKSSSALKTPKIDLTAGLSSSFVAGSRDDPQGDGDAGADAPSPSSIAPPKTASKTSLGDAWMAEASLLEAASGLAGEWSQMLALAGKAVELEAQRQEDAARAQTNPDHPVASWMGTCGWKQLNTHARSNLKPAPLPLDALRGVT